MSEYHSNSNGVIAERTGFGRWRDVTLESTATNIHVIPHIWVRMFIGRHLASTRPAYSVPHVRHYNAFLAWLKQKASPSSWSAHDCTSISPNGDSGTPACWGHWIHEHPASWPGSDSFWAFLAGRSAGTLGGAEQWALQSIAQKRHLHKQRYVNTNSIGKKAQHWRINNITYFLSHTLYA